MMVRKKRNLAWCLHREEPKLIRGKALAMELAVHRKRLAWVGCRGKAASDEHRAMAYKSNVLALGTPEWVERLGKHKWVQEEEVRGSFG